MLSTPSLQTLPAYQPEHIWLARRRFFDEGHEPTGLVSDPVLRGWKRCLDLGRSVHESVDFMLSERLALGQLMDRHATLMQAARPRAVCRWRGPHPQRGLSPGLSPRGGRVGGSHRQQRHERGLA
jgi:hypothetical protein